MSTKAGGVVRPQSVFRDSIGTERFPAESGRYSLYVSYACPWAHRTVIVRALKGLEDAIGLVVVDSIMGPEGWRFAKERPDPNGNQFVKGLYLQADPSYSGRNTVPMLWDNQHKTVVNNESSEIVRILNTAFNSFSSCPDVTFYPQHLRKEIDEVNEWIYDSVNNGVYKAGFATDQEAYELGAKNLFAALDRIEDRLSTRSYLVQDTFTEADIRLFTTIVRFDPVYHGHFKCNLKSIGHDYPNILKWAKRVYQTEGVAATVNIAEIKKHYYMSHLQINPNRIVPISNGPDLSAPIG